MRHAARLIFFITFCCCLNALCQITAEAQATRPRRVSEPSAEETSRGKKGINEPPARRAEENQQPEIESEAEQTNEAPPRVTKRAPEFSSEQLPVNAPIRRRDDSAEAANVLKTNSLFPTHLTSRMLASIENKLGIPYRFTGTTDDGYDCSGFVWRVFQEAGLSFERGAARHYWTAFPEATEEESQQFGTLVFFSGLTHVGIVRDANSFYHASRTKGVMLSPLDGYWSERITGYRRVPLSLLQDAESDSESRTDRR